MTINIDTQSHTSSRVGQDLHSVGKLMSESSQNSLSLSNFATSLFTDAVCIDLMERALQVPVSIDCVPNARPIRQRFYQVRQRCRARGDRRFDSLTFQIHSFWLLIYWRPPDTPRLKCGMIEVREGMRFCALPGGIVPYGWWDANCVSSLSGHPICPTSQRSDL